MKSYAIALAVFATLNAAQAGTAESKMSVPMAEANFGRLTIGGKFSSHLQSGYIDVISGISHSSNHALFVNLRGTHDDSDQQIFSAGLGFRYLLADPGIIFGGNVYYDYIDTPHGNGFNQLGVGAEVLTKWVDARLNYYLPEEESEVIGRTTRSSTARNISDEYVNGAFLQRDVSSSTTTQRFTIFETALEGWNSEIGFLVPGVEKYFDLRLFAGYYSYEDPKGGNIDGFKARAEARVTEGITLDVEYWDDKELVGGNWVAGARVSLPFDIGNLFQGRNPFEGAGNVFSRPQSRELSDRLDEMVIRSHRIMTSSSNPTPTGSSTSSRTDTIVTGIVPQEEAPAPDNGEGEGEGEGQGQGGDT